MDRAEAIKRLTNYAYEYINDGFEQEYEAVKMAVAALREQEQREQGCKLCRAGWIDIEVRTVKPHDMYVFSTNEAVGLMFCPMCGRKLKEGADHE